MKKLLLLFTMATITIFAQSPEAFNYQAVVRDGSGNVIANQAVGVQIRILQGSASGTAVYTQTFTPTTNSFGLINLEIGDSTAGSGVFAGIDWGADTFFIETAIDIAGGTSYVVMGTSQLLSVPYALYAEKAGNSFWDEATNGIRYNGGNVGIGNNTSALSSIVTLLSRADGAGATTNLQLVNDNSGGSTYMLFTGDGVLPDGSDRNNLGFGINNTTSTSGPNEAFLWYYDNYDIKFGIAATELLRLKTNGNLEVKSGDVFLENIGSGVIIKSPNGTCWRMTVDNSGAQVITGITCP